MANRYRGEVAVRLGERTLTLRLTLDALARLETALDAPGLSALTDRLLGGDVTASQMQAVLCEALVAGGAVDRAEAEALLRAGGTPLTLRQTYVDLMRASFTS